MRAAVTLPMLLAGTFALSACSLFEDKDWREGTESAEACIERLTEKREIRNLIKERPGLYVPLYTYDITKMDLAAIDAMIVPHGEDGELGSLRTSAFGATAEPVSAFMALEIDEDGAFYFGEDPSLYRVPGEPMPTTEFLVQGCADQQPGMRLIDLTSRAEFREPEETDADSESETPE